MIELISKYNTIIINAPYSVENVNKIRAIDGRVWDYKEKHWLIPLTSALKVYETWPHDQIKCDEKVQEFINSQNGKDVCYFRQIAADTVEVFYHYHKDIQNTVDKIVNKYQVPRFNNDGKMQDVRPNYYTMSLSDAKKVIKQLGEDRCKELKNQTPTTELHYITNEKIKLHYKEPTVIFNCSEQYGKYLTKMIPQIGKNYKEWNYTMPLHVVPKLIGLIGENNIEIPEDIKIEVTRIYEREIPTKERLENIKPIKEIVNIKTELLPHQIEAFNIGTQHNRLLIADTPGLGKTLSSIAIATYKSNEHTSILRNCLIVCGVNSVKYNWQAEIEMHSTEKCIVFDGTLKKKLKKIDEWFNDRDTLFGIINIESLRNQEILDKLNSMTSMVIVDEIHKAKNGNSKQGKALRELTTPEIRIGLSGTPMTNKPEDLWNILSWLGIENKNFWSFRNRYCVMGGYENKEIVDYKNLSDLALELKEVMLRRTKDEVIKLPPKTYQTEYIELSNEQSKEYKDAEKGVLEHAGEILNTNNPLTSLLRMRQITSGLYCNEKNNTKLKRLQEILEESIISNGGKAIIFSQYEEIAKLYRDALSKYNPAYIVGAVSVEDRQKEVDRFQNDKDCKIAIGTIGAMGTGLTMTAASYVFFIDKDWAQTNNEQAEDRAHRIGTASNVTVISLVAKNTIDERIEHVLKEKANLFDAIINGTAIEKENKKDLFLSILDIDEKDIKKTQKKELTIK